MSPDSDMPGPLDELYTDAIKTLPASFDDLRKLSQFKLSREKDDQTIEVIAATSLHARNSSEIFTAIAKGGLPNDRWAKALIATNLMTRRYETLFWQTGDGALGLAYHHRDAVRFTYGILVGEKRRLTKYLQTFGVLRPEEWPIPEMAELNEHILSARQVCDQQELCDANEAAKRDSLAFKDYHRALTLGLQITGRVEKGDLKVVRVAADSSLNSTADGRRTHVKLPVLAEMIPHFVSAIHYDQRGFQEIELGLSEAEIGELNDLARSKLSLVHPGNAIRLVPLRQ